MQEWDTLTSSMSRYQFPALTLLQHYTPVRQAQRRNLFVVNKGQGQTLI